LLWIEAAGYRALPPAEDAAIEVFTGEQPDDETASRLLDRSAAIALLRLNIQSQAFMELVKGQAAPTYQLRSEHIPDLNRSLIDAIAVIAHRAVNRE
jgi:hypothetical protein